MSSSDVRVGIIILGMSLIGGCGTNLFPEPRVTDNLRQRCPDSDDAVIETAIIGFEILQREGFSDFDILEGVVDSDVCEPPSADEEASMICRQCIIAMIDHVFGP